MIKPGSFIEWHNEINNCWYLVPKDTVIFSAGFDGFCHIGSNLIHMCIAIDDVKIMWLNERGIFRALIPKFASCYRIREI